MLPLILIASLAACSDSGSGSGSGVDTTKKLNQLSGDERQQLCEYMVEAEGGVHSKMCGDGLNITVQSATECTSSLATFSASCTATVDNAEACAEAAGDDLCNLLSSQACSFLFQCQ
ncbi:MAG TPA: hypothetical protein VIV40_31870 [Kofleriaceae bacterium]